MDVSLVILALGLLIFLAHIFVALFDRLGIPDILPLMLLGLFIGPVMGLVTQDALGQVGPVFSTIALVVILFESGLGLKFAELRSSLGTSTSVCVLSFLASAIVAAVIAVTTFGFPIASSIALGFIIAGTSSAVIIPLLANLAIDRDLKVILTLESSISDVLCIIGTLSVIRVVTTGDVNSGQIVGGLIASLTLSTIMGFLFGVIWSYTLNFFRELENAILTTPAFLCILYALSEIMGFSGPVAALSFGVTLGNVRSLRLPTVGHLLGINTSQPEAEKRLLVGALIFFGKLFRFKPVAEEAGTDGLQYQSLSNVEARELNYIDRAVLSELSFAIKTFFFVYLGLSIRFGELAIFAGGVFLTLWIYLSRIPVTLGVLGKKMRMSDVTVASIMAPKGLAAAVLASMPLQAGMAFGAEVQNITYSVILVSTVLTALLIFLTQKGIAFPPHCFVIGVDEKPAESN